MTKEEIRDFIKESVEWLISEDMGCCTLPFDDRLAICVGWLPGYGEEKRDDCIQSENEPDFAINAGIKVYTSDDMRTDYEFINMPYRDNGDVLQTDVSIEPDEDYDKLAEYFLKEYEGMKDLEIDEDGRIIEEDDFEDSYEKIEDESLKEDKTCGGTLSYLFAFYNNSFANVLCEKYPDIANQLIEIAKKEEPMSKFFKKDKAEESCDNKSLKESWEGEDIIDDLIERAQSMYDDGGYGDIDDCVSQAINDGLIYTSDIHALLHHLN